MEVEIAQASRDTVKNLDVLERKLKLFDIQGKHKMCFPFPNSLILFLKTTIPSCINATTHPIPVALMPLSFLK